MNIDHDKSTDVPSLWNIFWWAVLGSTSATVYFWLLTGEPGWARSIGVLMWSWISFYSVGQAWMGSYRRVLAGRAPDLSPGDLVGSWRLDDTRSFTVRWDEAEQKYYVAGWIVEFGFPGEEVEWVHHDWLAENIEEAEIQGMAPAKDKGTRGIRARLDIPGWDGTDPREARRIRDELAGRDKL